MFAPLFAGLFGRVPHERIQMFNVYSDNYEELQMLSACMEVLLFDEEDFEDDDVCKDWDERFNLTKTQYIW